MGRQPSSNCTQSINKRKLLNLLILCPIENKLRDLPFHVLTISQFASIGWVDQRCLWRRASILNPLSIIQHRLAPQFLAFGGVVALSSLRLSENNCVSLLRKALSEGLHSKCQQREGTYKLQRFCLLETGIFVPFNQPSRVMLATSLEIGRQR